MALGVKGHRRAGAITTPPHYGLSLAPFLFFSFFSCSIPGRMFVITDAASKKKKEKERKREAEARLVKLQGILGNGHYERAHN